MKKYIIIALSLIMGSIILTTVVTALSARQFIADEVDFEIIINEENYKFSQPIVAIKDRTYLPIREFCNAIGYNIDWDEERRVVSVSNKGESIFYDNIYTSREGNLENGRKYVFYGIDEQDFNVKSYIENADLFESKVYDIKIQERTIEAIAEKVQMLLGLDNVPSENVGIAIYYDAEAETLMFIEDHYGVPQLGGFSVIIVSCKNGLTTMYSSRGV